MEVRQIAALIIALLTVACIVGTFFYATREVRANRRGYKRSERLRLRKSKERMVEATRLREKNSTLEKA